MPKAGEVIEFNRVKQFKYIKPIGAGGTGDTHLFEDETTDMLFAFKKYVPKDTKYKDELYLRFVDEIKILFKISHPNIVRIYNYYLYPEIKLGYLQMEYVDGVSIDKFQPDGWGKEWSDIFIEVIRAFEYLENNDILHRDIRPENILIDKFENVKLIDFGFGKKLDSKERDGKSVLLNWPVTELPEEILNEGIYNHQSEVYFVGKLFQNMLEENADDFCFNHIIEKMTKTKPKQRYKSFVEVSKEISAGIIGKIDFSESEKEIYISFANELSRKITKFNDRFSPINDIHTIISMLASLVKDSALEKYIQANDRFINCFISGSYTYNTVRDIEVECVKQFYEFFISLNSFKQKIVLDNVYNRLSLIRVEITDELPF
jgi:serine/threonine-protein kinase